MRILAFTDSHGSESAYQAIEAKIQAHKPDLLICCGDFTVFGQSLGKIVDRIASWKLPCLMIHGNHESRSTVMKACEKHDNLTFVHLESVTIDSYDFIGYGGGGFAFHEPELEQFMKTHTRQRPTVLITHAPPHGTKLDSLYGDHVGCKTVRKFIKKFQPLLALAGHIEENFAQQDAIQDTICFNPGPSGTLIDLSEERVVIAEE